MPTLKIKRDEYYRDIEYEPREWQRLCDDALDNQGKRFVAAFSFPRGGKSYWAARHVGPQLLKPDTHCWIAAPTYELGSKEFLYIYNDLLNLGFLNMPGVRKSRDIRGGMHIDFPWGSFLKVVSADRPDSLRAEELDYLILAEASALPEMVFLHNLFIRVEKRHGKVLVPTTPKGFNWVYDSFRLPSLATIRGEVNESYDPEFYTLVISADPDLVQPDEPDLADIYEGSVYSPETVARAKRMLPTPIFVEQFGGGFASYAGLVFPYSPSIHRVKPFNIPDHWTHVIGYDHGALPSPTAILAFSYDPNGHTYWWGEVKGDTPHTTASQYLDRIRQMLGPNKSISGVGVDPSAKQVRIELQALGLTSSIAFDKSELAGIIRLTAMMNERSFHVFEGCCKNFEHDLLHFMWDEKTPKRTHFSKKFHFIAAARYGSLVTVPLPSEGLPPSPHQNDPAWQAMWAPLIEMKERARQVGEGIEEDDPWGDELDFRAPDLFEEDWM